MQPKTVMVIGGTGFLGRYAVKMMTDQGWRVKVVSRHPFAVTEMRTCGEVGQVAYMKGDLAHPDSIIPYMQGVDAVVNLVGILYESPGKQKFNTLHALGAEKIAQAAKRLGIPLLVYVSVLGADRVTNSHYARTKLLGEKAVREAFPEATILRPSVIFGPEDNFFNKFAWLATYLHVLPLIGKGVTRFQPVYVGDVARVIVEAIRQPERAQGRVFELGGTRVLSFRQLMEYILEVIGRQAEMISISFGLARLMGLFAQWLPRPMLTADQVALLKCDNVISGNLPGMEALGISPTAMETIVPEYLKRYRKGGK